MKINPTGMRSFAEAFFSCQVGVGDVIRNEGGSVMLAISRIILGCFASAEVEALALRDVLNEFTSYN